MLRGRVPVLRLGSRGPGGHQKSCVCVRKRLRSPCKCLQAFANVGECHEFLAFENGPEFTQNCRFLATVTGIGRVLVAKRRSVVTFGLILGRRVSKVSTITRIGGSLSEKSSDLDSRSIAASQKWQLSQGSGGSLSQNADLSSLLDSHLVAASQKCQQSQASEGSLSQNGKIVRFGLAFDRRVSKVSTVTGLGESWPRNAELSTLLDLLLERRERLEEGGERREERREEERERKGQRRERRGERRKEREEGGEWREERGTIGDLVPRPNDRVLGPFWVGDG